MRSLVVSVVVSVALLAACGTYNYNRAALVPHATPRLNTGQPLTGRGQLTVGASSLAHLGGPSAGDPNAGVEIPGTQLFGNLRAQLGDTFSVGVLYENGLDHGAVRLPRRRVGAHHRAVALERDGYGLP